MTQDAEVAKMYMEDHDQFESTARFWTETYAIVRSSVDEAVQRLVDMGFPAVRSFDLVQQVLSVC